VSESEPPERANLATALANEEARLRRLEVERADATARADALRAELDELDAPPLFRGETVAATTTASRSRARR